ncbi:MAG: hypothetical protein E7367_05380 [Clostridiales bacterium]|nr:hypothetical protein [Clostridiales bacterium]
MLDQQTVWIFRAVACLLCACFYFAATAKLVGVMQQGGYKAKKFLRWYGQERNAYFSRMLFWSVLSLAATALFIFVFYFLHEVPAMALGGIPFFGFAVLFFWVDKKFALKVQAKKSGRWARLCVAYCILIAVVAFGLICLCSLLDPLLSMAYGWLRAMRFLPLCFLPLLLPYILLLANAITAPFENARNRKFIKRAGQVLDESEMIKIGIVGSYGKTSVKNILHTLLLEKYSVAVSPASYNTPIGVAKTVFSDGFEKAQVAIFEMGARQEGDIKELCELVKPDYILFTGVCAQHIQTFGSEEAVFRAKCEALFSTAKTVVCGKSLEDRIAKVYPEQAAKCVFARKGKDVELRATETAFTLALNSGEVAVKTALLGEGAVENISLAACLAEQLGLTRDEIARGVEKLQPVEHRLQLTKENGVYILDDAYNCNIKGAKAAIAALCRFEQKKYVITPGIVETGVLHSEINGELGCVLAGAGIDLIVLVGETQARVIEKAYLQAGGEAEKLIVLPSLEKAVEIISGKLSAGDCILFMNDLPDVV